MKLFNRVYQNWNLCRHAAHVKFKEPGDQITIKTTNNNFMISFFIQISTLTFKYYPTKYLIQFIQFLKNSIYLVSTNCETSAIIIRAELHKLWLLDTKVCRGNWILYQIIIWHPKHCNMNSSTFRLLFVISHRRWSNNHQAHTNNCSIFNSHYWRNYHAYRIVDPVSHEQWDRARSRYIGGQQKHTKPSSIA